MEDKTAQRWKELDGVKASGTAGGEGRRQWYCPAAGLPSVAVGISDMERQQ